MIGPTFWPINLFGRAVRCTRNGPGIHKVDSTMQNLTQTANKLFAKNEISNQKWSGHKTGLYPNILHARLFDVLFTEWPFQLAIWLPARLSLSLQQSPKMLPITLPKRLARSVLPLPNAPVLSALDVSVCYFKNYSNFLVFQKFSNT